MIKSEAIAADCQLASSSFPSISIFSEMNLVWSTFFWLKPTKDSKRKQNRN
jgi:hypothetical protein